MKEEPKNTWELANDLVSFAKMLKSLPKLYFTQKPLKSQVDVKAVKTQIIINFSNFTVSQLKKECRQRGIKGYSNRKKQELINLLNDHDRGMTTLNKISNAFQHIGE